MAACRWMCEGSIQGHRVASCVWCFGERRALSPLLWTRGEMGTCRERSGARIDTVNFCGACEGMLNVSNSYSTGIPWSKIY